MYFMSFRLSCTNRQAGVVFLEDVIRRADLLEAYLYCAPVEFAVQPDCRPPARYFPGGITVNPGGLQYSNTKWTKTCFTAMLYRI